MYGLIYNYNDNNQFNSFCKFWEWWLGRLWYELGVIISVGILYFKFNISKVIFIGSLLCIRFMGRYQSFRGD